MLAISPLRSNNKDGNNREGDTKMEASFPIGGGHDFPDFSGANLLDSIDFDDLFMGMHEGDVLPDLEMDPELLADFSISGGDESEVNNSPNSTTADWDVTYVLDGYESADINDAANNEVMKVENNNGTPCLVSKLSEEVEIESKNKDLDKSESTTTVNSSFVENEKGKKLKSSSSHAKTGGSNSSNSNNHGKRKTKVDWTPELHRRFVQAVEQLGVDKAVPSRILELMGIDCLTRHNIASHLQKYRSHRKHLLAREAEAATWTQKRQMYGVVVGGSGKSGVNISPWHPPTIGFPPMTTMHAHHPFRPLHVWGHPTMDPQASMPMWPKPTPLPPSWTPPPPHLPPADLSFWHSSHQRRLPVPLVPGIPPHAMYRPEHNASPPPAPRSGSHPQLDLHPSKESIDAAIGDVLAKPWLPLPIGLKPPLTDSVLGELQRQGISKIPPSSS